MHVCIRVIVILIYERKNENINGCVNKFVKKQAVVNASLMTLTQYSMLHIKIKYFNIRKHIIGTLNLISGWYMVLLH